MRTIRDHLKIIFNLIRPETLIENIVFDHTSHDVPEPYLRIENGVPSCEVYQHFSRDIYKFQNYEEVDCLYYDMRKIMEGNKNIFHLITEYTKNVLVKRSDEPICRKEEFLNWRSCCLALGQDLFTTAYLADKDIKEGTTTCFFGWRAVIDSDDEKIHDIFDKGLSENHFHLNGSSRTFDLTWICMMNYPEQIRKYFSKKPENGTEINPNTLFREDLSGRISLGADDNQLSWADRLYIAAMLRAHLFKYINDRCDLYSDAEFLFSPKDITNSYNSEFYNDISALRFNHGKRIPQTGRRDKRLDYALTDKVFRKLRKNRFCRALAGERAFMYDAFGNIYSEEFSRSKEYGLFRDLFYLYLLIKSSFRSEIIQTNERYGFKNFALYQSRKDTIFKGFKKYELEALNLSVNESMDVCHVSSLEMRVTPKNSVKKNVKRFKDTDDSIFFLKTGKKKYKNAKKRKTEGFKAPYFYVLHFPKIPEERRYIEKNIGNVSEDFIKPRNYELRKISEKQARSLAKTLERHDWICSRLRGIDACSYEIGCRPEVFSTEFRFLRNLVTSKTFQWSWKGVHLQPKISCTYHVGEDFLDIADGLRAIDEAVNFLELQPGDRLGHALALGVDPSEYYSLKKSRIILPKQDRLDNIVWLIYRSKSFKIAMDNSLKDELLNEAYRLMHEIYPNAGRYTAKDHFNAWKLRGDDPELYRFGFFNNELYEKCAENRGNPLTRQYNISKIMLYNDKAALNDLRADTKTAAIYSDYHFNFDARKNGLGPTELKVDERYIKAVCDIQKAMQREIAENRLGIECNLSSNVLIGPFDRYDRHPILKFKPVNPESTSTVQFVSINTDDQGVFDTSLEEEFSLLACSLSKITDKSGNAVYNADEIYEYLEELRQNGADQIFPQTKH